MKNIKSFLLMLLFIVGGFSCDESFLEETPLDFFSTSNAFQTPDDFNASVNNLYGLLRAEFYTQNDNVVWQYLYRTDVGRDITTGSPNLAGDYTPISGMVSAHWNNLYKIVSEANTIISRLPGSQLSDSEKLLFEAKGRFFRAFAYRALAYLYGGVPLVLEETTLPKVDFVRATRPEVYAQAIQDLTFAATNLPGITAVKDGEISNLAAQHLLAEVYLADGQFANAVAAASVVIDDPDTDLMTVRFGRRTGVAGRDVYWDLFQKGNQNRNGVGLNKEAIWVIQIEPDVTGGAGLTTLGFANTGGYNMERVHVPLFRDVRVNGVQPFLWPAGDDYLGGRGVGFMSPSEYFINTAYDDPTNDIRNANHNFVRRIMSNNPASPFFGQEIDFANLPAGTTGLGGAAMTSGVQNRAFYPYQGKSSTPSDHPASLYAPQSGSGARPWPFSLKDGAGFTYRDEYAFRLAETYLLRAEAYLGAGNTASAAADINVVRARSNAAVIVAGDVTIDFILDERMREFGMEEKRMLTLMRLGKWYDRIILCNPFYAGQALPLYNLWPIPQGEIERNTGSTLDQNPGY